MTMVTYGAMTAVSALWTSSGTSALHAPSRARSSGVGPEWEREADRDRLAVTMTMT